jgi:hypothetical protein
MQQHELAACVALSTRLVLKHALELSGSVPTPPLPIYMRSLDEHGFDLFFHLY